MNTEYEIFECQPDGSVNWLDSAPDLTNARLLLQKFAKSSNNEHFGMCLATRELVFRAGISWKGPALAKRVFQIAYTETLGQVRADLLRSLGYGVLSVIGNDAAKNLLRMLQIRGEDIAFFMVGHAAHQLTRNEIVDWLRARYPTGKIIALNPPNEQIPRADHNVLQNGPELWLPLVTAASGPLSGSGCAA
jgi:hypothetical protein